MGYCRFENTYNELVDCKKALDESGVSGVKEDATDTEEGYVDDLIQLCIEIAEQYGYTL